MTDRFYGYCRVSTAEQTVASLDAQEDMARETCEREGGEFVFAFREVASGAKVRWNKRPGFADCLKALERGDHLVVWRLDRIDRDFPVINALQELSDRGIIVHIVEHIRGEKIPPLDSLFGKLWLMAMVITSQIWLDQQRRTAVESSSWRKRNGYAHNKVPIGKKRFELPNAKGINGTPLKIDVWDEGECAQIREIVRRRDEGESFWSIGVDFAKRQLTTAEGKRWAGRTVLVKGKQRGRVMYQMARIKRAYDMYKEEEAKAISEGKPLDCLPFGNLRPNEDHRKMCQLNVRKGAG